MSQGLRLSHNYLGMRDAATAPSTTRFAASSYSFRLEPNANHFEGEVKSQFDALRLVWHDYPGEWFEEDPSSAEEATRRIEMFRGLLKSDVALILVDGQKLLDYQGEEKKYLKSLLWAIGNGISNLKKDILSDGAKLTKFPRIWIFALSKADLHPDLDAEKFKDLVILKVGDDVAALRAKLQEFVDHPDALSIGQDFMLLSSAKFEPGKIEVAERVGVDLIAPVASLLPLEKAAKHARNLGIPLQTLHKLIDNGGAFAKMATGAGAIKAVNTFLAMVPKIGKKVDPKLVKVIMRALAVGLALGQERLTEFLEEAVSNNDFAGALLAEFKRDLEQGTEEHLIVRSI